MKTLHKITALTVLLGASGFVSAQTNETSPAPMDGMTDTVTTNDNDSGNWGLAGLLGLLGLLGMRRHRDDNPVRNTNTR